jgi:hypothetical protein
MTVSSAKQLGPPKLRIDEDLHRTYTTSYWVFGTYGTGPREATNAAGVPPYGSPMRLPFVFTNDFDEYATCLDVAVDYVPTQMKWPGGEGIAANTDGYKFLLTITHSTKPRRRESGDRDNPLDDPPEISGSFLNTVEDAWRDKDGKIIAYSNGAPVSPPFQVDKARDTLIIVYNTPNISLPLRARMVKKVNSEPLWGLQKRQVKLERWEYAIRYYGTNGVYIANTFEFHINLDRHPRLGCVDGTTGIGSATSTSTSTGTSPEDLLPLQGYYSTTRNQSYRLSADCPDADGDETMMDKKDNPYQEPRSLNCGGCPDPGDYWVTFAIEEEEDFRTIPRMPNPLPGPFV